MALETKARIVIWLVFSVIALFALPLLFAIAVTTGVADALALGFAVGLAIFGYYYETAGIGTALRNGLLVASVAVVWELIRHSWLR